MSINFTAQDSPKAEDTVYTCDCFNWSDDKKAMPDCTECKGTGEIRFGNLMYDINFSNANAAPFIELFSNGEHDDYGVIEVQDLPACIAGLRNVPLDVYRRAKLLPILLWAEENNKKVYWG